MFTRDKSLRIQKKYLKNLHFDEEIQKEFLSKYQNQKKNKQTLNLKINKQTIRYQLL